MKKQIHYFVLILFIMSIIIVQTVNAGLLDGLSSYYSFNSDGSDATSLNNLTANDSASIGTPSIILNSYNNGNGSVSRNFYKYNSTAAGWWSGAHDNSQCLWYKVSSTNTFNTEYGQGALYFLGTNGVRQMISPKFYRNNRIMYTMNGENPIIDLNVVLTANQWTHLCFVYNATQRNISIYVNGTFAGSNTHATAQDFTPSTIMIGSGNTLVTGFLGQIDEVGIWNRSLNTTEISTLYNSGVGTAYPFGDYLNIIIQDSITNNSISNFCINATGTNPQQIICTTNASIPLNLMGMYNISAYNISYGTYQNVSQQNFNFSNTSTITLTTYQNTLNLSVYQLYTNISILSFNVTNGLVTNFTTNGFLVIPITNTTNNIQINVTGNFSKNVSYNSVSSSLQYYNVAGIYDSILNVSARILPANTSLVTSSTYMIKFNDTLLVDLQYSNFSSVAAIRGYNFSALFAPGTHSQNSSNITITAQNTIGYTYHAPDIAPPVISSITFPTTSDSDLPVTFSVQCIDAVTAINTSYPQISWYDPNLIFNGNFTMTDIWSNDTFSKTYIFTTKGNYTNFTFYCKDMNGNINSTKSSQVLTITAPAVPPSTGGGGGGTSTTTIIGGITSFKITPDLATFSITKGSSTTKEFAIENTGTIPMNVTVAIAGGTATEWSTFDNFGKSISLEVSSGTQLESTKKYIRYTIKPPIDAANGQYTLDITVVSGTTTKTIHNYITIKEGVSGDFASWLNKPIYQSNNTCVQTFDTTSVCKQDIAITNKMWFYPVIIILFIILIYNFRNKV